jgi:hypothetical protein
MLSEKHKRTRKTATKAKSNDGPYDTPAERAIQSNNGRVSDKRIAANPVAIQKTA